VGRHFGQVSEILGRVLNPKRLAKLLLIQASKLQRQKSFIRELGFQENTFLYPLCDLVGTQREKPSFGALGKD
jgi:hypothetical protein